MDWFTLALSIVLLLLGIALLLGHVLKTRIRTQARRRAMGLYLLAVALLTFLLALFNNDIMANIYRVLVVVLTAVMFVWIRLAPSSGTKR